MAGSAIQTLEDLRKSADAAWLWDGMRGRLVWANAAGIAAFDGQSVFDLIDLIFDPAEPGVAAIAELTKTLRRDHIQKAQLEFPSTGRTEPWDCECWLHTLADGRSGLLVVSRAPVKQPTAIDNLFVQLPVAAVLVEKDGALHGANDMAAQMFDVTRHTSLASLLGQTSRAERLLGRLSNTSLVSSIESFEGSFGRREARLTLKRLAAEAMPFAVLVMDDITERRNMERQMADAMPPSGHPSHGGVSASANSDSQAFAAVARSLNEAISEKPDATIDLAQIILADKPAIPPNPASSPPKSIVDALENTGAALIIAQQGELVFASAKAVQLFGFKSSAEIFNDKDIGAKLCALQTSSNNLLLQNANYDVAVNSIPWINGPARQYVLARSKSIEKAVAPPPPVEPPPEPLSEEKPRLIAAATSRAAEDELKSILDIASDGIITLDQDGAIINFSAGAESLFGYRSAEVMARPLADFFSPESRKILLQYIAGLKGPGLAAVFNDGREVAAIVKQGGTVPLFLTIGKLQSAHSKTAFCAVMRDITNWKRTEKELREAKDAAEAASRQKSDFLARISHELRTPLNAIMGFSDVMRLAQFGDIKNEKYRGYVNDIHASGSHLLALINDLLDLSKIEAGKMELNFTAVNIVDCADHAIKLLQESSTRGRVLVRKSFPDKLPRVVADLRAMRQVLINLLSNALKFTDPGGQVIISATISKSGELSLKLKDTGIGMNAAQLKDALEPFKRVETSGRETQGTGLGLPLTKALVEANRAKFDLSSEPGQGTLIEITFPTTRVLAE